MRRASGGRQALQARGRDVVAVAPGRGAAAASPEDLGAIIVDVELAADWQHLRDFVETQRSSGAPLIVLTSWRAPDCRYRQMAFRMGGDAFVTKPCSAEALVAVVDRLAAGERAVEARGGR